MTSLRSFWSSLYLGPWFFPCLGGLVVGFVLGHFWPMLLAMVTVALWLWLGLVLADALLLYLPGTALRGQRQVPERLSNGDQNPVLISIQNRYAFGVHLMLIDELPVQFQLRRFSIRLWLASGQEQRHQYQLRPTQRGEYNFGRLNAYVASPLRLLRRRYRLASDQSVKVYPGFLQINKYQLHAISHRLTEVGVRRVRRISHQNEFEQIRDYVPGDDLRSLNWRATARRNQLMVNQYQDEKSQEVYCLIDMGRSMKMPFEGLSLLDYSINAALVLSNVALTKHDKAGLLCFSKPIHQLLPAQRSNTQMMHILEALYAQQTQFDEPDYERLYATVRQHIRKRSLLLLFTNFETTAALQRRLPLLRALAKRHLLVLVFFKNTELDKLLHQKPNNLEETYVKTIAEKFELEKRLIVKQLHQHGIAAVLTAPAQLTVEVINKYIELKAHGKF